ncbi:MAG: phosphosulfolactate synthase, partial [Bacteroidota bacterium]
MTQINLTFLPERTAKPRQNGIAMVMDKGLSVREAEDFVESAGHLADFVKLGFGTSVAGNKVREKVKVYQQADIKVYAGGTLFEAFVIRNMFDEYLKYIDQLGLDSVEVS